MACKCVVFDMDGILFDSESLVMRSWEIVAQKYQIPNIGQTCQRCLGINAVVTKEIFLEVYGAEFPYDAYKSEMSQKYWEQVAAGKLELKSGVREILVALRTHGFRIGIASSTRVAAIKKQLAMFQLEGFFDEIVGGDMVTKSKPDPEIYLLACQTLGVKPKDAYAVEDSYNGIRAASAAGMRPIMIPDLLPPNEEMEQLTAHIFSQMQQFQSFLFS